MCTSFQLLKLIQVQFLALIEIWSYIYQVRESFSLAIVWLTSVMVAYIFPSTTQISWGDHTACGAWLTFGLCNTPWHQGHSTNASWKPGSHSPQSLSSLSCEERFRQVGHTLKEIMVIIIIVYGAPDSARVAFSTLYKRVIKISYHSSIEIF